MFKYMPTVDRQFMESVIRQCEGKRLNQQTAIADNKICSRLGKNIDRSAQDGKQAASGKPRRGHKGAEQETRDTVSVRLRKSSCSSMTQTTDHDVPDQMKQRKLTRREVVAQSHMHKLDRSAHRGKATSGKPTKGQNGEELKETTDDTVSMTLRNSSNKTTDILKNMKQQRISRRAVVIESQRNKLDKSAQDGKQVALAKPSRGQTRAELKFRKDSRN